MIKRRKCLSSKHGGEVTVKVGKKHKPLSTFCRFYQHNPPKNRGVLCEGYLWYPPCPDLETCKMNGRRRRDVPAKGSDESEEADRVVGVKGRQSSPDEAQLFN